MDDVSIPRIIIFVVLLLFSAFFSGTETALFSLNDLERENLKKTPDKKLKRFIRHILSSPNEILITILTGNMFVNLFASSLSEKLGEEIFNFESDIYTIIIMTVILLIIGEMTPKNIAVRHALSYSRRASIPIYYIHKLLTPLRIVLFKIKRMVLSLYPDKQIQDIDRRETIIRSALSFGYKNGILDHFELDLFVSFLDFRKKTAEDVMIPRTDIRGIDMSAGIEQVLTDLTELKNEDFNSLVPIYRSDIDHLSGYIDVKDLIPAKLGISRDNSLNQILKPIHPVPHSKNLAELMKEMKTLNIGMSLVVDEYGGTAGIITFKKLVEYLLSHFYTTNQDLVVETQKNRFRAPGNLDLTTINELFKVNVESDSRTIAGMLIEKLGEIPAKGESIKINGFLIVVTKATRNRIVEVEIRRTAQE